MDYRILALFDRRTREKVRMLVVPRHKEEIELEKKGEEGRRREKEVRRGSRSRGKRPVDTVTWRVTDLFSPATPLTSHYEHFDGLASLARTKYLKSSSLELPLKYLPRPASLRADRVEAIGSVYGAAKVLRYPVGGNRLFFCLARFLLSRDRQWHADGSKRKVG